MRVILLFILRVPDQRKVRREWKLSNNDDAVKRSVYATLSVRESRLPPIRSAFRLPIKVCDF